MIETEAVCTKSQMTGAAAVGLASLTIPPWIVFTAASAGATGGTLLYYGLTALIGLFAAWWATVAIMQDTWSKRTWRSKALLVVAGLVATVLPFTLIGVAILLGAAIALVAICWALTAWTAWHGIGPIQVHESWDGTLRDRFGRSTGLRVVSRWW